MYVQCDAPFCIPCNDFFTVKHFLLECHDLGHIRNKFYQVSLLKDVLTSTPSSTIINYRKETGLYSKI